MRSVRAPFLCLAILSALVAIPRPAPAAERVEVADALKWNTADIFPTDDAWRVAGRTAIDRAE